MCAQLVDTSDPQNPVVRSDIQVPADADGPQIDRTVIVVDTFLDGQQRETIRFVLDERFRDRVDAALTELISRGIGIVFDPTEGVKRDLANSIRLNLDESEGHPHASIVMKQDVNREEQVPKILDTEFSELT